VRGLEAVQSFEVRSVLSVGYPLVLWGMLLSSSSTHNEVVLCSRCCKHGIGYGGVALYVEGVLRHVQWVRW